MNKKILIVDDEPNIVMALEYAFKKKDFEVFIARDGTEALDIAELQIPDVILLDIMMPKMDGYETLKQLKENKDLKRTKVIFLSAKNKVGDIEKGVKLGADSYITKPFSPRELVARLKAVLRRTQTYQVKGLSHVPGRHDYQGMFAHFLQFIYCQLYLVVVNVTIMWHG